MRFPRLGWTIIKSNRTIWNLWWEVSETCSQITLKCFCLERIGRPDLLRTVNYLARSVTKWNRACDLRPSHPTTDNIVTLWKSSIQMQTGIIPRRRSQNQPQMVFCDYFGSHTFVPISWACKKQTAVPTAALKLKFYRLIQDGGQSSSGFVGYNHRFLVPACWR